VKCPSGMAGTMNEIIGDNVDFGIIGYPLIEYHSVTGKDLCKVLI
jgi:hypothetical protein